MTLISDVLRIVKKEASHEKSAYNKYLPLSGLCRYHAFPITSGDASNREA